MIAGALVLLAIGGFGGTDEPAKDAKKEAIDKLQGSYAIVVSEIRGRRMAREGLVSTDRTVFDGDKVIVMRGGKESHRSTIRIDSSKDPMWMDFEFIDPQGRKSVSEGIYKLDGDTLTICTALGGAKRPKVFLSTKENTLGVMKRVGTAPKPPAGP
jgi:uncharacterized protein (TIGR03067 family)